MGHEGETYWIQMKFIELWINTYIEVSHEKF